MILKLKADGYKVPTRVKKEGNRLFLNFPFNRTLLNEIKCFQGRKWHGFDENNPRKVWSIPINRRNLFQLDYLAGKNPYSKYEKELVETTSERPLYKHQIEMKAHGLTRKQCIFACEMRTGKTLAAIEIMESSGVDKWVWVGPKSALAAVQLEFETWEAKVWPVFYTYRKFTLAVQNEEITLVPGIVFDESTKLMTPTSQRSQAAAIYTEAMREIFDEPYILELSGAPSPRNPSNWWHQCEIACPGFIKEGDIHKFRHRLAIVEEQQSITGGTYPKLITWKDSETKCDVCGNPKAEHDFEFDHDFVKSKNEVAYLYERMKGLVLVKLKKDCLDLPEKQFRKIVVEPTAIIKQAAQLIIDNTPRTVTALMKLRELSDGFQYDEEPTNELKECELCHGKKTSIEYYDPEYPDEAISPEALDNSRIATREVACSLCDGEGETPVVRRIAKQLPCPKDQVFKDLLDEHEPIGRFVAYGGFQASIDKLVRISLDMDWHVLRVDGRGFEYLTNIEGGNSHSYTPKDMLKEFKQGETDKLVFIGQPGAAGMGIDLAASPSCFFYSNTFNGEDRIQAMERIHSPGMDYNRGATIIDVVHLDTDQLILDNLEKKIDLLKMTMGELCKHAT